MVYFLKQRKTEPERKIKNKRKINFLGKERGTPPSPKKDPSPVREGMGLLSFSRGQIFVKLFIKREIERGGLKNKLKYQEKSSSRHET